ncbi:hypothetical protein ACO22_04639 [Paracoccidioides brasiliensis]|uniref:Uncharacterized protein n=1 Tax=Paracoccidioides brasiliensis TaxID=121759 RepID=A0A1D2JCR6_PARBR|nr:hypothetical protein ACO22_04639 [Paracoccidioides brasiliensis]ODH52001.1 hypothetical protein GX48_01789 [Paracoccidioides brasiliensis]
MSYKRKYEVVGTLPSDENWKPTDEAHPTQHPASPTRQIPPVGVSQTQFARPPLCQLSLEPREENESLFLVPGRLKDNQQGG